MKRILSSFLALTMVLSMTACGSTGTASTAASSTGAASVVAGADSSATVKTGETTIDSLKLGTDHTDLKADLKFLTHRTDIIDSVLKKYVVDFQKMYPNINITYEGITDYKEDVTTRLTTNDWGDICMIPTTINKTELADHFVSYGKVENLAKTYQFLDNFSFGGETYGISSTNNVQGIVYNKAVFKKAGIATLPKTPDEFLDALKKIKDKTDATPLYTNFSAGWTMGAWDAYIGGSATGDPDFMNVKLTHAKDPFAKASDGSLTGPYAVYYTLYEAVKRHLTESDPTTTDWEGSKPLINNGKIGTMVLGSWAVVQMQQAGKNAADIGYMTFPILVNGKQYASAGPDYTYGINKNSTDDNKLAAMLYVKYLVEQSNFDADQGGVPTVKDHKLPTSLQDFNGVTLVPDNPAPAGEEDLFTKINNESEISLNADNKHVSDIVENALAGKPTLDQIMANWNSKWTAAEKKYGAVK